MTPWDSGYQDPAPSDLDPEAEERAMQEAEQAERRAAVAHARLMNETDGW